MSENQAISRAKTDNVEQNIDKQNNMTKWKK